MDKNTKSREISERLRQEILGGKFDDTRKLPSEHQLMRRFSVARETVRVALKELLDKNLVDRRPGYGTFLVERAEVAAARKSFAQWNAALAAGVFVNVGEFGVWKKTPHAVTLALMEDELSLFKDRNLGWALWEFRGGFGILDSDREDVVYEDFHGHKLDRKMLELLRRY